MVWILQIAASSAANSAASSAPPSGPTVPSTCPNGVRLLAMLHFVFKGRQVVTGPLVDALGQLPLRCSLVLISKALSQRRKQHPLLETFWSSPVGMGLVDVYADIELINVVHQSEWWCPLASPERWPHT